MPTSYTDKYTQRNTVLTEKYSARGSSHTDKYTRNAALWDDLIFLWDDYEDVLWDSWGLGTEYTNKY